MKYLTLDLSAEVQFWNYVIEPLYNFASLDSCSQDDIFTHQDEVNVPIILCSIDLDENINEVQYEWNNKNNVIYEVENDEVLANLLDPKATTKSNNLSQLSESIEPKLIKIEYVQPDNNSKFPLEDPPRIIDLDESVKETYSNKDGEVIDLSSENEDAEETQKKLSNRVENQRKRILRRIGYTRQAGVRLERWNRSADKDLFQFIRSKLLPLNMELQQFLFDDTIELIDESNQIVLWGQRLEVLESAIEHFGWLNTPYFLFKRLRKLSANQSFSFREKRILNSI